MKLDIYGDCISYVTNEVSSIHPSESNLSEFTRAKFVTDLAAVSRGLDRAKNPERRYKSLLKEAAPTNTEIDRFTKLDLYTCPKCGKECQGNQDEGNIIVECRDCKIMCDKVSAEQPDGYDISEWVYKIKGSPSRPLEFLPVVVDLMLSEYSIWDTNYDYNKHPIFTFNSFADLSNSLLQHSYVEPLDGDSNLVRLYTNMRCLINAGIPYDLIPYNTVEELKNFRALKANIPMFVWSQVPNTHCALSKEAQSDRVTENVNYWLPNDLLDKVYKYKQNGDKNGYTYTEYEELSMKILSKSKKDIVNLFLSISQNLLQTYLKDLGYPKEIYSRAIYYFKYKEVVFTGWANNPKTFKHLFVERNTEPKIWKNWTQDVTAQFVEAIKRVVIS